MFEADWILTIASRTGWPEDFLRWRLPLSRGWAYWHAAAIREGIRCRWPAEACDWWARVAPLFRSSGGL